MKNSVVVPIIVGVVGAGLGFAGGTVYAKYSAQNNFRPMVGTNRPNGGDQNFRGTAGSNGKNTNGSAQGNTLLQMRGGAVTGQVTAKDDKSLTIKLNDGSSRIVNLSDSTTYRISSESSLDKIEVGTVVATFGSANSDGSTTATSVEINHMMRGQAPTAQ